MNAQNEDAIACWDLFDSDTGVMLERSRMKTGKPDPVLGEVVRDIGDWDKAEVVSYQFNGLSGSLLKYDVYVRKITGKKSQ
jgi:hypothetical protein